MSQALIRIKPTQCTITPSTIRPLVQSLISQVCSSFFIELHYSQVPSDYLTANVPSTLNDTQRADLYAELASGAETGASHSIPIMLYPLRMLRYRMGLQYSMACRPFYYQQSRPSQLECQEDNSSLP